jgi:hypothetical protein
MAFEEQSQWQHSAQPGDGTSVNQIVLAQPGLIPQMAGFLTSYCIWGTTNFCDHASDFVYVHLIRNFTLKETLLTKRAYEKVLKQAGRTARHCWRNPLGPIPMLVFVR